MNRLQNELLFGVQLGFRWCSIALPSLVTKMRTEKQVTSGVPLYFRRASTGVPSRAVRKTKPTTYPSDRYDSTSRLPPINFIHLVMQTNKS